MSWYYMNKLKTRGPVELESILKLIRLDKIKSLDLISCNLSSWKFAYLYKELFSSFKNSELNHKEIYSWVVTQVFENGSKKQVGPFSTEQLRSRINLGDIKYTDLAWSSGMLQWYPLSLLEVFNKQSPFKYFKQDVIEAPKNKEPKPYLVYMPPLPAIELPPEEADGESLV